SCARSALRDTGGVPTARFRIERWPDELRGPSQNWLSRCWQLHRPDSKRGQASRSSSAAGHESRTGYQPQNCEGARSRRPHVVAWPCRRVDRIMSRITQKSLCPPGGKGGVAEDSIEAP